MGTTNKISKMANENFFKKQREYFINKTSP